MIGYDVDLLPVGDDLEYRLDLPEGNVEKAVDISLAALDGAKATVTPETKATQVAGHTVYRFNSPAERTIAVRLEKPGSVLLRGTDPKAGAFFATQFRPSLPAVPAEVLTGLSAVAYRAVTLRKRPRVEVWPEPLTLGQPLPGMPLWLTLDLCVPVRLEESYLATCRSLRIPA